MKIERQTTKTNGIEILKFYFVGLEITQEEVNKKLSIFHFPANQNPTIHLILDNLSQECIDVIMKTFLNLQTSGERVLVLQNLNSEVITSVLTELLKTKNKIALSLEPGEGLNWLPAHNPLLSGTLITKIILPRRTNFLQKELVVITPNIRIIEIPYPPNVVEIIQLIKKEKLEWCGGKLLFIGALRTDLEVLFAGINVVFETVDGQNVIFKYTPQKKSSTAPEKMTKELRESLDFFGLQLIQEQNFHTLSEQHLEDLFARAKNTSKKLSLVISHDSESHSQNKSYKAKIQAHYDVVNKYIQKDVNQNLTRWLATKPSFNPVRIGNNTSSTQQAPLSIGQDNVIKKALARTLRDTNFWQKITSGSASTFRYNSEKLQQFKNSPAGQFAKIPDEIVQTLSVPLEKISTHMKTLDLLYNNYYKDNPPCIIRADIFSNKLVYLIFIFENYGIINCSFIQKFLNVISTLPLPLLKIYGSEFSSIPTPYDFIKIILSLFHDLNPTHRPTSEMCKNAIIKLNETAFLNNNFKNYIDSVSYSSMFIDLLQIPNDIKHSFFKKLMTKVICDEIPNEYPEIQSKNENDSSTKDFPPTPEIAVGYGLVAEYELDFLLRKEDQQEVDLNEKGDTIVPKPFELPYCFNIDEHKLKLSRPQENTDDVQTDSARQSLTKTGEANVLTSFLQTKRRRINPPDNSYVSEDRNNSYDSQPKCE